MNKRHGILTLVWTTVVMIIITLFFPPSSWGRFSEYRPGKIGLLVFILFVSGVLIATVATSKESKEPWRRTMKIVIFAIIIISVYIISLIIATWNPYWL